VSGMAENGQATVEQVQASVQAVPLPPLDPDHLRPRDWIRASENDQIAGVLQGLGKQEPWELLGTKYRFAIMVWCFKSRLDPAFTWDQALDSEFGEFGEQAPPPLPAVSTSSGSSGAASSGSGSSGTRSRRANEPSS
jgi:hypothetical protein